MGNTRFDSFLGFCHGPSGEPKLVSHTPKLLYSTLLYHYYSTIFSQTKNEEVLRYNASRSSEILRVQENISHVIELVLSKL